MESISRLGRKTLDILNIIQQLEETGVQFISLNENMDTRTSTGGPADKTRILYVNTFAKTCSTSGASKIFS